MRTTFINKIKKFKIKFRYNFVISDDFVIRINLKALLIIKRMINLNVNVNKDERVAILSLSVLNNHFIANFKSNKFETITIFNEILFEIEIEMKLNKLLIFFSTIAYFF